MEFFEAVLQSEGLNLEYSTLRGRLVVVKLGMVGGITSLWRKWLQHVKNY